MTVSQVLKKRLHVFGDSKGIIIPKDWLVERGMWEDEFAIICYDGKKITIKRFDDFGIIKADTQEDD